MTAAGYLREQIIDRVSKANCRPRAEVEEMFQELRLAWFRARGGLQRPYSMDNAEFYEYLERLLAAPSPKEITLSVIASASSRAELYFTKAIGSF